MTHSKSTEHVDEFAIAYHYGWTWVKFDYPPSIETRSKLKRLGFHWSSKNQAWYARWTVDIETLED